MSENFDDDDDDDDDSSDMFGRVLWALLIGAALLALWMML